MRLEDESAGSVSAIVDGSKLTIMVEGGDLNLKTLKVIIPISTAFLREVVIDFLNAKTEYFLK